MTRTAVGFDRLMTVLAGLVLMGAGGLLVRSRGSANNITGQAFTRLAAAVHQTWWPWSSAGAGIILILLGLRWLAAHHRSPKAARIGLPSPTAIGSLSVDADAIASAAADSLRAEPPLLKAATRATIEHGVPTLTLTATTPARHGLTPAAAAADKAASTAALMAGDAIAIRTRICVDTKSRRRAIL